RFALSWNDLVETERAEDRRLTFGTLWADRRWRMGSSLSLEAGMRADAGGKIVGASIIRPAPSFQARYAVGRSTTLSGAIGRSFQSIQEVPTRELSRLAFSPGVWLAAGETTPYLRNDQANFGIERWSGAGVLMAANVYARRSMGIVTSDPRPGGATGRGV